MIKKHSQCDPSDKSTVAHQALRSHAVTMGISSALNLKQRPCISKPSHDSVRLSVR